MTTTELRQTVRVGDALAFSVLLVGGLGAIRALTAIAALAALTEDVEFNVWAFILLLSGWVVAVGLWPLYGARRYAFLRPVKKILGHQWLRPIPGQRDPSMLKTIPRILLGVSIFFFLFLGLAPTVAGQLGVVFCFVMALASITGIVAGIALITRKRRTAEVFQLLRLRSTPTLGLLLVALVFAGQVNTLSDIHRVRADLDDPLELAGVTPSPAAVGTDTRPDLPEAFASWMAQRDPGCALRRQLPIQGEPREVELVPMVMIAAEGGGIRAAYWAVQSVQQLAAQPCPSTSVFLSSGVSGGALGLAAVRFNQNPTEVVTQMSNSRALSYGIVGLMVRDFVYAATGLPLPAIDHGAGSAWVDRAALMEDAWSASAGSEAGWTGREWATAKRFPATGQLIMNSMSVGRACRVWISDIRLRPIDDDISGGGDKITCDQDEAAGLRSVDLISSYGADNAAVPAGAHPGCLYGMEVTTAAMLAARFPYITPSGWIGECGRRVGTSPDDQLIDGGYLENTGLGTINDLSDEWLPQVRAWNDAQSAAAVPRIVVPLVLYLDNDSGNDRRAPQQSTTNEALVPPLGKVRAISTGIADEANRQRTRDLVSADHVCGSDAGDEVCRLAVESLPRRMFLVFPASTPQIAAPLGWVLSQTSRDAMDSALQQQADAPCPADPEGASDTAVNVVCDRGYGSLRDLLDATTP